MTVTVQLSDEEAAALQAKAAAQGLSLEKWFKSLVQQEIQPQSVSVVSEMRALRARVKPDPEGWTTRDYVNYGRGAQ
jgi:DNA-binding protein H-NS